VSPVRGSVDDPERVRIGSSPIKVIATRAVGACCADGRFRTPFQSDAISARRAARPGRPLAFDRAVYARRNVVERCINRLKQWRGLATRYEKRAANYRAMVVIASLVIWLES
jgi:transposase